MFSVTAKAQVSNYTFSQSTTTYTSIWNNAADMPGNPSNGYSPFSTTSNNRVVPLDIPFYIYVNGIQYYQCFVSSNGFISFGIATAPGAGTFNPISGTDGFAAALSAMGTDLALNGFRPRYATFGIAPYRVFVIEMKNCIRSGYSDNINFQYRLYETSNKLEINYGPSTVAGGPTFACQVGLRGANNTDYKNRSSTTNWSATAAGGASNATVDLKNSIVPANGLNFTFSPPVCTLNPLAAATAPNMTAATISSLNGGFVGGFSDGYLVVRTNTSAAPTTPVTGMIYPAGSYALNGYIESNGTGTTFTSSGLSAGTQYWYWVYPYTSATCSGFPTYKTTSVPVGSGTTVICGGAIATNSATTSVNGTQNWSALTWSLGHLPTPCENAIVTYSRASAANSESLSLTIDVNVCVNDLTFINSSNTGSAVSNVFTIGSSKSVIVNGNLLVSGAGSTNRYNRCALSSGLRTLVNGNTTIGSTNVNDGLATIGSNTTKPDQTYIFKGDVSFLRKGLTIDEHTVFTFDGTGTQNFISNSSADSATDPLLFETLNIGQYNTPTVVCSGTYQLMDVNDKARGGVNINNGSTLVLPANFSLNAAGVGSSFRVGPNAVLRLGGKESYSPDYSGPDPKTPAITNAIGSNFPLGYSNYVIDPTSLVDYNGDNTLTQTVYNGAGAYGKLQITNGGGIGRAQKITTGVVTVGNTTSIMGLADLTLGIIGSTNCFMSSAGNFDVANNGGLYCNANEITGAGNFSLNTGSFLGTGHPQGLTSGGGATGSIRMGGTRSFTTTSNYIYNGLVNQITTTGAAGLPLTCNNLTIDNPGTVTLPNDQLVNGTNLLKQGTFLIGTQKVQIGTAGTLNSTGGFMNAKLGVLQFNGTSGIQNLAPKWFTNTTISTLINNNSAGITVAAPSVADTMLIASALLYGGVTGSTINTNDNLTLLSRDTATARFGDITGNAINGKVTVERYVPVLRKWRLMAINTGTSQTAMQTWMENNTTKNGNIKPGYGTIVTDEKATAVSAGYDFDSRSVSGPSVKYYNSATDTYTGIPNTQVFDLKSKSAYYNFVRGDRTCIPANALTSTTILRTTGLLKTGNISFPVTAARFEMIGNPYASAVDLRALSSSNLIPTIYIWDTKITGAYGLGAYQMLSLSGGNYTIMPGGGSYGPAGSVMNFVESGQGLFVKSNGAAGSLTFVEPAKNTGTNIFSKTARVGDTATVEYPDNGSEIVYSLLSLVNGSTTTLVDGAMVAFGNKYSNDIDVEDAPKLPNTSENVGVKRNNVLLAIERRKTIESNDTIFLNLTGLRVSKYQWDLVLKNMDAPERKAFLIDAYKNTSTELNLAAVNKVQFDIINAAGSYAPGRFMIVFHQPLVPVKPFLFTGIHAERNTDKTVTVTYFTNYERLLKDYVVEHSSDGIKFSALSGTSPVNNNGGSASYLYDDKSATEFANYYRIRSVNDTGKVTYSNIAKVAELYLEPGVTVYPNPVIGKTMNIHFTNMVQGVYDVKVLSKTGQAVEKQTLMVNSSNEYKTIQLTGEVPAGSYQLSLQDAAGKFKLISFIVK